MTKRSIIILGVVILAIGAGVGLSAAFGLFGKKESKIEVSPGKVHDIKTFVRLCSVELYAEVPVLDTINGKVIFAVQKQNGSISFDVEKLKAETEGDTVRVVLPPEIIEVYESTEPNSWEVIDTKNITALGFLKSSRLTAEEENAVKSRIRERAERRLYEDGTVERARTEAAANLAVMLENVYLKPVLVSLR